MRSVTIGEVTFLVQPTHGNYWDRASTHAWEHETFDVLDSYLTPDTTLVDIGAWIGPISLYAATRAKHVIAVEPDPAAFRELEANVRANPAITNIRLVNAAISNSAGVVRLGVRDRPGDSTSSLMLGDSEHGWEVQTITLANLLADCDASSRLLFKIDIEGFEFELLPGIIEAVRSWNAPVYLSLHPHYFELSAAAHIHGRGRLARLKRSVIKRTKGRVAALRAIDTLIRSIEGQVRVVDEKGAELAVRDWKSKVARGRNVTATGAVLLLPL